MILLDLHRRDTICAAATPSLPSAIAVIRVSGPAAISIKEKIFIPRRGRQSFFVATFGDIPGLDEAVCTLYPNGKSYTGEPCFELSVHGSPIIVKTLLRRLQEEGCRLAEPGEFSLRACLSGKMDLCAAEAVCDLINARSVEAAQMALRNVKGALGSYLEPVRESIVNALCETEARLDFPDENLGEKHKGALIEDLNSALGKLQKLVDGAEFGTKLTQGARVAMLGLPNAGKSTLLNALVGEDRALVHHLPGTTRDVVEASWLVNGIPVSLVDVAGIRAKNGIDPVEALGIEKAHKEIARADGLLWLIDGSVVPGDDHAYLSSLVQNINAPILKIYTKSDLISGPALNTEDHIRISAKTGEGLDLLHDRIREMLVRDMPAPHDVLLTKMRQKEEVLLAMTSVSMAISALSSNEADEVVASELRAAGAALDRLLGKTLSEDVLDLIFSRFCIGK